ncbi:MAG: bifunctional precorrin-2 dehydrogenase/sirohydrochlorin ferrochelatase [Bacteroidota bacterium]
MNQLYPIFLKTDRLHFLIVGGGFVGTEKLENLLKSSPNARVTLISPEIRDEIYEIAKGNELITLIKEPFHEKHIEGIDVAILATNIKSLNAEIRSTIKQHGILVNVADTPDLCDFYMCSVVTKGDLKIGISTNGKSPTLAKRLRELFTDSLPDEIPQLLDSLQAFRNKLKGDFAYKVKKLDELTKDLGE